MNSPPVQEIKLQIQEFVSAQDALPAALSDEVKFVPVSKNLAKAIIVMVKTYARPIPNLFADGGKKVNVLAKTKQNAITLLHLAFNKEVCAFLIKNGLNVNAQDKNGKTPLHWAIEHGHRKIYDLLIEHEANITILDRQGRSPFILALKKEYPIPPGRIILVRLLMLGPELPTSTSAEDIQQLPSPNRETEGLELLASVSASVPQMQRKSEPMEQPEENQETKPIMTQPQRKYWEGQLNDNKKMIDAKKYTLLLKEGARCSPEDELLQAHQEVINELQNRRKLLGNMWWVDPKLLTTATHHIAEAKQYKQCTISRLSNKEKAALG